MQFPSQFLTESFADFRGKDVQVLQKCLHFMYFLWQLKFSKSFDKACFLFVVVVSDADMSED